MTRSDVAHYEGLTYWGPVSVGSMEQMFDHLELPDCARVIDIGCGRGEVLVRLAERHAVEAVGVDRSAAALAIARLEFDTRCPSAELELLECDGADLSYPDESFDLVAWLGGPYVGDSFESTVAACARWLRGGGFLLLGHGFWMRPPPAPYLTATRLPADLLGTHEQNIDVGIGIGLTLVDTHVSTREEWDTFEGTIFENHRRYAAEHSDDAEVAAMLESKRTWHEAQEQWGRDTMGFALYLFRRAP